MCSSCGKIPEVRKTLKDRVHECDCGTKLDRDHNDALNILVKGKAKQEKELNEVTKYKGRKYPLASAGAVKARIKTQESSRL